MASRKHNIFTPFPKRPHLRGLQANQDYAGPLQTANWKFSTTSREKFGDLTTADHKVLNEGGESRNNHLYAVVVQDLATQRILSYPCKTKTSQETERSLPKLTQPSEKAKVIKTDNSLGFGKSCEDISWIHRTSTPHRSETNGTGERAVRRIKGRDVCCIVATRLG